MTAQSRQRPKRTDRHPVRRSSPVREAEELARRYDQLLEAAGCVEWQWDVETGRVVLEGDAAERLGLTAACRITSIHDLVELVHPDDRFLHQTSLKQALLKGRGPYSSAFRIVRPDDGRVVFIEDRGVVDWEQDYSTLRVVGYLFEIPGPKAA